MEEYISQQGLEKLKKDLEILEGTKRKEIASVLREAISFGDLSENAQYHEAKREQSFLEGKILELRDAIKKAVVVGKGVKGVVSIGSKVTIEIDGDKEKIEISGGKESDPLNGVISCQSPLGKVLLGKRKGAKVEYESPIGKKKAKILGVE